MTSKSSNKGKIIQAAKELFNLHGAANVGTNKIAAHLGISPGNLYYHFKNKEEIIRSIFPEINQATTQALAAADEQETFEDILINGLQNWMTVVWDYRFFYGNLVQILRNDPLLQEQYLLRREATLAFLKHTILTAGSKLPANDPPLDESTAEYLATNIWIIALNWIRYLQIGKSDKDITKNEIEQGAQQIYMVLSPYLDAETKQRITGKLPLR
ncbi:TetR/AcrR family transcriptional regulator [Sneathiella marina]|uniref:TetR/AcrR family transcriptional regulator n=1 Tax=Sneathiella marina TaxID=2950108 RepID=A0ABY4W4F3_9PROT|nr:TetR/AcrR family transcriptional regulator [Sneathiella marina]USG62068.1 TetR/AcrR family transcriptional regulator [Sneathiella marina]